MKQDVIFTCLAVQEEIPRRIEGFMCQNSETGFCRAIRATLDKRKQMQHMGLGDEISFANGGLR